MADLTTTAAVKAFAGVTGSGDDTAIGVIVSAVSAFLHGIVGNTFDPAAITGELHARPPSALVLLKRPLASVTTVREAGQVLGASSWRAYAGTRLVERMASGAPTPWAGEVSVDYTPASAVPADLELAAREAAAWVIKESGLTSGASRLGLTAQANADTGAADYFVRRIEQLPIVAGAIRRYGRFI